MKIERFEDIEAWQLARELTGRVYGLSFRMYMIMPDAPAMPFVVSSSTCWLMSRASKIKATLNP